MIDGYTICGLILVIIAISGLIWKYRQKDDIEWQYWLMAGDKIIVKYKTETLVAVIIENNHATKKVTVKYNAEFNQEDLTALAEMGIHLNRYIQYSGLRRYNSNHHPANYISFERFVSKIKDGYGKL